MSGYEPAMHVVRRRGPLGVWSLHGTMPGRAVEPVGGPADARPPSETVGEYPCTRGIHPGTYRDPARW